MGGEGQITNELVERMRSKIRDALQAQRVEVADVQGDGRHVEIVVVSEEFEGKSAVNRQRMVYKVGTLEFECCVSAWKRIMNKDRSQQIVPRNVNCILVHQEWLREASLFAGS